MQRPLSAHDLLVHAPLNRLGREILIFDEVDSTNALLRRRADAVRDGTLALAELQTAGRGRHGHRWLAPRGASILLSFLLIEPPDSPVLTWATVLACLAACEAIAACTDCEPRVRWPNDIVLGGRKLGGVLAESSLLARGSAAGASRALVVGLGINCLQQRGHFVGELAEKATSLEIESAGPVDRAAIAARLVNAWTCDWRPARATPTRGRS